MTRVTAPFQKLARSLSAQPTVARPSYSSNTGSHTHAAGAVARRWSEHDWEDNNRRFTMTHRPTSPPPAPSPSHRRTVPLMQTFRTSASKPARLAAGTVDDFRLPSLAEEEAAAAYATQTLRVPLLPDNESPDRASIAGHAPEAEDSPLAAPQIVVVAAYPDRVAPASALTEMEGVGIDGVELKFAHHPEVGGAAHFEEGSNTQNAEPGMLRDLWKGLVDDLVGPAPRTTTRPH